MADEPTLGIRQIPPHLKGRIAKRVDREGSNMNDVLVAILAKHYQQPYTPQGRKRSVGESTSVLLTLPPKLKDAIEADAFDQRESQRNVAMKIICAEFGVKFKPTGRWRSAAAA